MSALGRLLGRTERRDYSPSWAIPSPSAGYWNASGYPVNTDSALRLAAFYACVNLIANSLATTPVDVYRRRDRLRVPVDPIPSLILQPEPGKTQVEWFFSLLTSVLTRGNTYGVKGDFDALGYPRQITLAHPDDVSVRFTGTDRRTLEYRFNGEVVPLERVFHLKGFTMPGWSMGLSVVAHHAQTIGLGLAASSFGAGFYQSGGHPTSVLKSDQVLDAEQARAIKERLVHSIRAGGRDPIVLGAGLDWQPIQLSPNESQFLEAQRYTATDIARLFNIPPEKIGAASEGNSLTYGNREANVIEFQTDALLPWAVRIEQALNPLLPRGQFVKFNLDAAIRVDLKSRYDAHAVGLSAGFLEVNEVRELEDRPPIAKPEPPPMPVPPSEEDDDAEAE